MNAAPLPSSTLPDAAVGSTSSQPERKPVAAPLRKWIYLGAALLAGLWLGSYWLVPWIVASQLAQQGTALLGRQVTVGAVAFKPWSLELTLHDLAVAAPEPGKALLRIRRLMVNADIESLWRLAPVIDAAEIEAPELHLSRDAKGLYDIEDVLARLFKPGETQSGKPLQFALYNLRLTDGSIQFEDHAKSRSHALRGLQVAVPFLSNLPSQREVKVVPHLAFELNGSHFDSAAESTPFAASRHTEGTLAVTGLDLKPYLAYLPATLPVHLASAELELDLKLGFEQVPENRLRLSGRVGARQVGVTTPEGKPLFSADALHLDLSELRPFERVARFGKLEIQAPHLTLQREVDGRLQWPAPAPRVASEATETPPATPKGPATPGLGGWQVALQQLVVRHGGVRWVDQSLQPRAQLDINQLALTVENVGWPAGHPVSFHGSGVWEGGGSPGNISYRGTASLQSAQLTASVANLALSSAAPYMKRWLQPDLSGSLHADLGLSWKAVPGGASDIGLHIDNMILDKLALIQPPAAGAVGATGSPGQVLASIQKVTLGAVDVQPGQQRVGVGSLLVQSPQTSVERGADGRWMYERWLTSPVVAGERNAGDAGAAAMTEAVPKPWTMQIGQLSVEGGAMRFSDRGAASPVALDVNNLNLSMQNVAPGTSKPASWRLSARMGAGSLEPGSLAAQGSMTFTPLAVQAAVDARRLPAHALAPYAGDLLRFDLLRADVGYLGQAEWRMTPLGASLKLGGDVSVEEFNAHSLSTSRRDSASALAKPSSSPGGVAGAPARTGLRLGNELLSWKALALRGLDVAVAPGVRTQVEVKETALSDFFARVIVRDTGRLNLQDLIGSSPAEAATTKVASAAPVPAPGTADPMAPIIRVGPVSLIHGKVYFSDRFIKPNYSADLSELTGRLGAFSSEPVTNGEVQLADLSLRGRAEGTASLDISGKLNPLAKPLALDIQGRVRDLELPPLSPYAIKYVGHGIERGKLSMDVAYVIKPDGQLTANNKLVLNQLTFGDPVEGAKDSLPVKMAAALLADRNGVIDLDLPISGSLNDPQFSLGPIIFKVVMSVIGRALTSPFSLLAHALGGGDHESLSSVAFPAGSARLSPEARRGLDKVALALTERPALTLTVAGSASVEVEREAFQRERLLGLLRAEKRRAAVISTVKDRVSPAPSAADGLMDDAMADVTSDEYPLLLKEVYHRADVPKPRNLIGTAKDIPVADMEKLLLANLSASAEALRQLALQRGVAVKDYLAAHGVPAERLFLGAAKAVGADPGWKPRAELSLATH